MKKKHQTNFSFQKADEFSYDHCSNHALIIETASVCFVLLQLVEICSEMIKRKVRNNNELTVSRSKGFKAQLQHLELQKYAHRGVEVFVN